jgi:hypothetical protein
MNNFAQVGINNKNNANAAFSFAKQEIKTVSNSADETFS